MVSPNSWEMASQEVKDYLEKLLNEAAKLLVQKLGLTLKAAVAEADNMRPKAFEDALDMAMELSESRAVQPDWLMVTTADFVWQAARRRCQIPEEEKPGHDIEVPDVKMTSSEMKPSPEHLVRLIQVREEEISEFLATLAEIWPAEG